MQTLANNVQLIGHLGQDPQLITTNSGRTLTKFTLATSEFYKNAEGQRVQNTEWHNVVVWGKRAESAASLLRKGLKVAVSGKLTHRTYETEDGQKKYFTEINLREFKILDKREKEDGLPF